METIECRFHSAILISTNVPEGCFLKTIFFNELFFYETYYSSHRKVRNKVPILKTKFTEDCSKLKKIPKNQKSQQTEKKS